MLLFLTMSHLHIPILVHPMLVQQIRPPRQATVSCLPPHAPPCHASPSSPTGPPVPRFTGQDTRRPLCGDVPQRLPARCAPTVPRGFFCLTFSAAVSPFLIPLLLLLFLLLYLLFILVCSSGFSFFCCFHHVLSLKFTIPSSLI